MNKQSSPIRFMPKKTLFFLALSSLILFIFSLAYFLFVSNDQINSGSYYKAGGVLYADLTTITQKESWSKHNFQDKRDLVVKQTIKESFTAKADNLGTIAISFDTHDKSVNEKIAFRVKEKNSKNWYYQNTYNANQFQNNIPFPFGFPVIVNSKNKSYTFQIETLTGKPNNSFSLSKTNTYFFSKYKFSKTELIKNPHILLQFLIFKVKAQLLLLTSGEIIFIFLFSLSPFIFYYYRFRRKIMLRKNIVSLVKKYSTLYGLSHKKYIFYATTMSGIFLFLLNGLITRGHNFYNLLFIPSYHDYFMDFFNVLYSLFNGPYTYGSIYPPFPLLIYKLLLRFVPYDIADKGPVVIRGTQSGEIAFLFYMLITLLFFLALIMEVKRGTKVEKYIFSFVILFSAPFLFQFERANIIFVALLFLMIFVFFKDSKNRILRELAIISLAISGAIKIYPLVFGLILVKKRRYKDVLRVLIYSIGLFFLPLFALGGIDQLPILAKNILSTSNETTKWGFGYMVNIQNMTRMIFGFLGDFGQNPIVIGRYFSFAVFILGLAIMFVLRSKWKIVAILTLLMILVPSISYEYTLIFMIIPLIMFLDQRQKEKWDFIYLICFILIFIPFVFGGGVDILNNGFRQKQFLPITYGVLIQNVTMLFMLGCLILEKLLENKLKSIKKILRNIKSIVFNNPAQFDKFYWIIPVFIILVYNLIFFNRSLPITEGWFSTYAWLINHGQFPYRDFYFFLTPLYLIKMSIFTTIFGYDILYLRIFGIGVILLMTYFLYKNFEILFKAPIAAFVATVGMIYYQSGVAHITYDFTQFITLYGLIQSYFLLKYIKSSDLKTPANIKWVFLAGLFAGLTFLTKQSNGAMIAAFSFAGLFLLSLLKGKREILRVSLSYVGGFAAPVIVTILWLLSNSAFVQFKEQVFTGAVSAKGGLIHIFFGWFREILTYDFVARFVEILFVLVVFGYWIYFFKDKKKENENLNRIFMLVASLAILLIVLFSFSGNIASLSTLSKLGQMGMGNITVAAISISLILIFTAALFFILKKPFNKGMVLFSFVSLGFIYGTGTSAGLSEAGAFAGFCLFIALMLHYRSILGLGKLFIVFFCMGVSLIWVEIKYERPYYWWNVTSADIRGELQASNKINLLHGMYTSKDNINLIEEVSEEIRSGSKPGEPVLTFPNIPLFYLLTDRKPPGKALVYWFDFLPDKMAIKEAELIKKNPPKVIVYLDVGSSVWEAHENLFRNGKPSGQRKIVEAFMWVIDSNNMHVVRKYDLENGVTLTVWRN